MVTDYWPGVIVYLVLCHAPFFICYSSLLILNQFWSPKLQWQWATNWPIQVAITSREKRKSQFPCTLKKTFTCNLIPALWLQLNVKFKEIVNFLPVWILLLFIEGHTHWILHIAWSPDGKKLASGCKNGEVRKLWCNIII